MLEYGLPSRQLRPSPAPSLLLAHRTLSLLPGPLAFVSSLPKPRPNPPMPG